MAGLSEVVKNVMEACEDLGDVEISGIKLESADSRLLDVGEMDLDRHVAIQASAIAYFGSLKKEAGRRLAAVERAYDRWQKKKYVEARAVATNLLGKTLKVEDVKAQYLIDNEQEIEKWDARMEQVQAEADTLDVWYEAWKTKGFSLREHVQLDNDERFSPMSIPAVDSARVAYNKAGGQDSLSRVKAIIAKQKEA